MINELMEGAGLLVGAAALEQTAMFTMWHTPWAGLAAGKGIIAPGVLNIGNYGVGKGIALGMGKIGLQRMTNTRRFFAGGNMFTDSLGFDEAHLADKFQNWGEKSGQFVTETHRNNAYKAKHLRFAGKLAGALAIANLAGSIISPLIYSAGAGVSMVGDLARQPMQAFNSPDWGNQLGSAFMTSQAVTERQRAQQMLQQTGIVGHGSMGKEANRLHG